jgi:tetratricopeptide (TPR) repeat protein
MTESRGWHALAESLSATQIEELDRLSDQFDAAWRAGKRPMIERFLGPASGPLRSVLLAELIAVEVAWRERFHEQPAATEYQARFPDDPEAAAKPFGRARFAANQPIPGDGGTTSVDDTTGSLETERVQDRGPGSTVSSAALEPEDDTLSYERLKCGGQRFRVLRSHARGGLGEVFVALDQDLAKSGQLKPAEAALRATLKEWEGLSADAPATVGRRHMIRNTLVSLANIDMQTGRTGESLKEYSRAVAIGEQLVKEKPDDRGYRESLALSYSNRAVLELNTGQLDVAEEDGARARARFEALAREEPQVASHRRSLAECLSHKGSLAAARNQPAEAETALSEAIALYDTLAREHPDVGEYRHSQGTTLNQLGLLFLQTDRPKLAEPPYKKASEILEELAKAYPTFPDYRYELAMTLNDTAGVFLSTNRLAEGQTLLSRALAVRQELADQYPTDLNYAAVLGASQNNMGYVRMEFKDFEQLAIGTSAAPRRSKACSNATREMSSPGECS